MVKVLIEKYNRFSVSTRPTVSEFWGADTNDGMAIVLLYFSTHATDLGLDATDKRGINVVITSVLPKLESLEDAIKFNKGTPKERQELESEVRGLYATAIEILIKYQKIHEGSREPSKNSAPIQQDIQIIDQTMSVVLDYFEIMRVMSFIKFMADRVVLELNLSKDNVSSIVNTIQGATGFCEILSRSYQDLFRDIIRLLPQERWEPKNWEKVTNLDKLLSTQISQVILCFRSLSDKRGEIVLATDDLLGKYRQLCEVTLSEILANNRAV